MTKFITSLVLCFSVAFLGSLVTFGSIPTWYAQLNKPFFAPPNWVFGPVWSTLYFLMAMSLSIVWNEKLKHKKKEEAMQLFVFQLSINLLWSFVFFGFHQPLLAFLTIIVLWISIFATIKYFYKISKISAYLLYPYIAWVTLASVLNAAIVVLNR